MLSTMSGVLIFDVLVFEMAYGKIGAMNTQSHFHVSHTIALPFSAHAMTAPKPLQTWLRCEGGAETVLWRLDWGRLAADDRDFLEGGEYLPALGFCWLARAAALLRFCRARQLSAALLHLPSRQLTALAISDVLHMMGSDAWLDDGQIALVWGMPHQALMPPAVVRQPLPCRGAVFPCGDGLNTGWWARAEDIAHIQ